MKGSAFENLKATPPIQNFRIQNFGPSQSRVHGYLPMAVVYDLLDAEVLRKLLARPKILSEENPERTKPAQV